MLPAISATNLQKGVAAHKKEKYLYPLCSASSASYVDRHLYGPRSGKYRSIR